MRIALDAGPGDASRSYGLDNGPGRPPGTPYEGAERSLRIKLQDDYRHPRFIATVPGEGYRFIPTLSTTGWNGEATASERTGS